MTIIGGHMYNFEQVKQIALEHIDLIKISPEAISEPEDRATKFLVMIAILSDFRQQCESDKAKIETLEKATKAKTMATAEGKGVTEKKIAAEANPEYTQVSETLGELDSMVNWSKNYIRIFENAHLTYRAKMRD